jgi:hypothetical protein
MILADTVRLLTTMTATTLSQVLEHSGHKGRFFKSAEFVGITNGGEFAYRVTYPDEPGANKEAVGKVFVNYDVVQQYITATIN